MTREETQRITRLEVQMGHITETLDKVASTVSAMHDTLLRRQGAESAHHRILSRAHAVLALIASLAGGSIVTVVARKFGH